MATPSFTAACCVIGDEILNGKTQDVNSHYLARFLFELGIDLKRIEVVGDDPNAIADSVRRLSKDHDVVFTSGGIGLFCLYDYHSSIAHASIVCLAGVTHDDISYQSVADAFGLQLQLDSETHTRVRAMLAKHEKLHMENDYRRLATFPHPSRHLRANPKFLIPVVVVNNNIYMLPGVPRLFRLLVDSIQEHMQQLVSEHTGRQARPFIRVEVATQCGEADIASALTTIQEQVRDQDIKIGSYPVEGKDSRVVISIVGRDRTAVQKTASQIIHETKGWEIKSSRL
ncbi:MoaB/Mog domain-containing protein [Syncephalastrum racemosum]|uniref:MoaB/Mog domain-containing protein n=1 Tax=Syncephalastrum racemosum TaxID=13706 RepID=A0A1X2HQX6_SYNRA|nr:MoaB/Mog domain-containing protein [Syncephalastrum racemosum]